VTLVAPEPDIIPVEPQKTLPHSSKIVLGVLVSGATMTQKDLVERTKLAPKTVRYGLKRLVERRLVIRKLNFRDGRQIIYQTAPIRSLDLMSAN
jgi:DNA-binding MarR family transcriptional regulator